MKTNVKILRDGKYFYTIRSRYVFNEIMSNEDVCLEFLQLVFPELDIRNIKISSEQTMENRLGRKGVRLDVYIEEKGASRVIDMEMQVADDTAELPKRTRYYSSTIDGWLLKSGDDYNKLCNTIVLFVCPFDPFGKGQRIYTFEHTCKEEPSLPLNDGQQIRILNTIGAKGSISEELQAVFDYITSDDGETEGHFAKRLKDMVSEINEDAERIGVVMTFEEELKHRDHVWQDRLAEKEVLLEQNAALLEQKTALLEQNAVSLEQKDTQLSEQIRHIEKMEEIITDLKKQIEALKNG